MFSFLNYFSWFKYTHPHSLTSFFHICALPARVTSEDAPGVELADGEELRDLVHLPRNWPLAQLTIPLDGLSKQIDRLLEGYCLQILATNRDPDAHNGKSYPDSNALDMDLS